MPAIPEFTGSQLPYTPNRAVEDPNALAAPGLAQEQAGRQMEAGGRELADLVEQHNNRAYYETLSDVTNTAHANVESGMEEVKQNGNHQGFTARQLAAFDTYAQEQLANAPGPVQARLERRFSVLRHQINTKAAAFEHQIGGETAIANISADLDRTGVGLYRDPSRFVDEVGRIGGAIDSNTAYLNPEQRQKLRRTAEDSLAIAAIKGRAAAGDEALAGDIEKGRYDSFLTPQSLERLQPLLDNIKGRDAGRKAIGLATPRGAVASQAVNTDIPAEGRALLDSIAGPESGGAYDVRYTPAGGTRFADLSKHPRVPEPGPEGPSTAAGRYQITAQTNDEFAPKLGISDFSPKSQDALGWAIAQDAYKKQTGGDLLDALKAGKTAEVQQALRDSGRWKTADLSSFTANLAKYSQAAGGAPAAAGLLQPGNIDLNSRPVVKNPDGSISTVKSMSFNEDGKEVLIPTVAADGSGILSNEDAIAQYRKTGQFLGKFDTPEHATAYAQQLHQSQAQRYASKAPADAAAPDLDKAIASINAMPGLNDAQRDKAISEATREYHRWHQETAQQRAQLLNDTQNGIAMLAAGRDFAEDRGAIRRLLPAEKADELTRAIGEARDLGNAKNRVQFADPKEVIDLQVKSKAALNDPTDFARKQRYDKALNAAIDERDKGLRDDPAAYARMAPAVDQAWASVDPQSGAGTDNAIRASLAEQERLGVKPEDRRALTKPQAAAIVAQIANTDPEKMDMGAALDGMAKLYDAHWPRVFGDLVKAGLPPEAQILGAMDQPEQAAARTDYQRMLQLVAQKGGSEQLKKAAPHEAVQAIGQGIDDKLAPFRATVRDPRLYDAVKSGVEHLAYYYAFKGQSADQALSAAYDGILARKYDFDGALRVPKGQLGTVERAGDAIADQITADQLPDIGGNPQLTADQRRGIYLSAIRNGRWVTSEDDTAAVRTARFRDGSELPAKRADGSRISFKFGDAAAIAARAPAMPAPPYQGP
jgi:muramidase (phage lysozyme)